MGRLSLASVLQQRMPVARTPHGGRLGLGKLTASAWRLAITVAAIAIVVAVDWQPQDAAGEQAASVAHRVASGYLDAASQHTCAVLEHGRMRCWGTSDNGQLGYGNTDTIGDNETPASAGPVDLGAGRTAVAIATGGDHSCAILDTGRVRCWGQDNFGQLGYADTQWIGDDETPGTAGPVHLGAGRTAVAISAGNQHTCAILDNGTVLCWGSSNYGQLGYGNTDTIGDNETPASAGPVDLGAGRTAVAISAGAFHTCAILDNGTVLCWGYGRNGRLGYGNTDNIGDDETPSSVGPVDLGIGRTAVAISAGDDHTCALLDDGTVRCWGRGFEGQLGYGNMDSIGDNESPSSVGPVDLGPGRTAVAISAGYSRTCAVLDNGTVLCWGESSSEGWLGYGNTDSIGDDETPASAGPVDLGGGRTAVAISADDDVTCALLDNERVRCWGYGFYGQLGYGNLDTIGDDETPGGFGPVSLGGKVSTRATTRLSLRLNRRRDRRRPFKFKVSGKLTGFIADVTTCSGKVKVRAWRRSRTVAAAAVPLRLASGQCSYRATIKLNREGNPRLTARFPGNTNLTADASRAVRVRTG